MKRRCLRKSPQRKTGKNTAGHVADEACPRNRSRHVYYAGDLHAVLYHDRLFHDLQHGRRAGGLGLPRNEILWMLMMAVIGFGVMVPIAGLLADAFGRRKSMVIITTLIILFALFAFTRCWVQAIQRWYSCSCC